MTEVRAVFTKLHELIAEAGGYSTEVFANGFTLTAIPPGSLLPDGMQPKGYRIDIRIAWVGNGNGTLSLRAYFGHGYREPENKVNLVLSRSYSILPDGSFNERKVLELLVAHRSRTEAAISQGLSRQVIAAEQAARRVLLARAARFVLGDSKAFRVDSDTAEDEFGHFIAYLPNGVNLCAAIAGDGTHFKVEAAVVKPETLARILTILRQERSDILTAEIAP